METFPGSAGAAEDDDLRIASGQNRRRHHQSACNARCLDRPCTQLPDPLKVHVEGVEGRGAPMRTDEFLRGHRGVMVTSNPQKQRERYGGTGKRQGNRACAAAPFLRLLPSVPPYPGRCQDVAQGGGRAPVARSTARPAGYAAPGPRRGRRSGAGCRPGGRHPRFSTEDDGHRLRRPAAAQIHRIAIRKRRLRVEGCPSVVRNPRASAAPESGQTRLRAGPRRGCAYAARRPAPSRSSARARSRTSARARTGTR